MTPRRSQSERLVFIWGNWGMATRGSCFMNGDRFKRKLSEELNQELAKQDEGTKRQLLDKQWSFNSGSREHGSGVTNSWRRCWSLPQFSTPHSLSYLIFWSYQGNVMTWCCPPAMVAFSKPKRHWTKQEGAAYNTRVLWYRKTDIHHEAVWFMIYIDVYVTPEEILPHLRWVFFFSPADGAKTPGHRRQPPSASASARLNRTLVTDLSL